MYQVKVDLNKETGVIKPMHAVNNGPVHKFTADQQISNLEYYKEAGIPYARTHDASYYSTYGGEHTIDVHAIFPDFNKNPYHEDSYDFACTDEYLRIIAAADTKVFYRLGSKIEHWVKKYGTVPPADFKKWAVICEHIIRHYTKGWAHGFNYDIEYWEIWNEPECASSNGVPTCWQGTYDEFVDFFCIALQHLKEKFPSYKIGGPAFTGVRTDLMEILFSEIKKRGLTLDFFSWHQYSEYPHNIERNCKVVREFLDSHGFENTESIINEWNYVKDWKGEAFVYSIKSIKGLKGAAFTAATMLTCQNAPLDMLMYYDARPCAYNGLFTTDIVSERLKGYYPFKMFNELYKIGKGVSAESDNENIYTCAAANGTEAALMVTYYDANCKAGREEVKVDLSGVTKERTAELYLLDEEHDMEMVETKKISPSASSLSIDIPLNGTYLILIK